MISDAGAFALAHAMISNKNIQSLSLFNNELTVTGLAAITNALLVWTESCTLNLYQNQPHLVSYNLRGNKVNREEFEVILVEFEGKRHNLGFYRCQMD